MPPVAARLVDITDLAQGGAVHAPLVLRPDLGAASCREIVRGCIHSAGAAASLTLRNSSVPASNTYIGIGLFSNSRRNDTSRCFSAVTSETVSDSMSPNAVTPSCRQRFAAVDLELPRRDRRRRTRAGGP